MQSYNFQTVSVESLQKDLKDVQKELANTLDRVVNVTCDRTYSNTLLPIICTYAQIEQRVSGFSYAFNLHPKEEVRKAATEINKTWKKFFIDCNQRKDVYQAFKNYQSNRFQTEKMSLTFEEVRFFEHKMRSFRRQGLDFDDESFVAMKKRVADLSTEFNANLNAEDTSFEFTKTELDGLPDSFLNDERKVEGKDNVYKVTLKYPDYVPLIEYANNREVRKTVYTAFSSRCGKKNPPLMEEIFKLRHIMAQKLGYKTHADFRTETNVMKTGQAAVDFVNGLSSKFDPLLKKDMDNLIVFAKEKGFKEDSFEQWDLNYYIRLYKESVCDVNLEEVRQYFPLETVTKGLFDIYQHLLGLRFVEDKTDNKWHESVKCFKVSNESTGGFLGWFYLDLHPRKGKYSHAACFDFSTSCNRKYVDGQTGRTPSVASIICNFPKTECLQFKDVVTYFHEFGHLMHCLCARPEIGEHSAFNVEWDFVEAPSQMLEYWCYTPEALSKMSSHKTTGTPVSAKVIEKLRNMKNVMSGYTNKRQLTYGCFDLTLHTMKLAKGSKLDLLEVWNKTFEKVMHMKNTLNVPGFAAFGHIINGYDAGYYGYMRSESFAANMFYRMFKNGHILDAGVGMLYRKKLLEPGSTRDALDLLEDFLGEKPDDTYFLVEKGLVCEPLTKKHKVVHAT